MEEFNSEEMGWNLSNDYTKEGKDKQNLIPISLGIGVNMWLNDNIGIGLQGDYLIMPYKHIANSWQGSIRLMWRIGGKSLKVKPEIQYVEKIIEKEIEKPIIMKQIVETPNQPNVLYDLFNNIYFEFDKTEITPKAATIIDEIAQIMLTDTSKKYLITGCTDAKGSSQYNMELSQKRADAVVNAQGSHSALHPSGSAEVYPGGSDHARGTFVGTVKRPFWRGASSGVLHGGGVKNDHPAFGIDTWGGDR